jgi:hypothetical protein
VRGKLSKVNNGGRERGENDLPKGEEGEGKTSCPLLCSWPDHSARGWNICPPYWEPHPKVLNRNSALKKLQYENGDNICIWTLFSVILGSLESPQRAIQLHP